MGRMPRSCLPRWWLGCVIASVFLCLLVSIPKRVRSHESIHASAPFDVLATHLHEPTGLALDPTSGDLFIAETGKGIILRLDRQGALHIHATGFKHPRGLAWDPRDDSLLVVDERAGTLSRITSDRVTAVLRDDLEKPHWVAVAEDGTIYLTAEEGAGFRLPGRQEGVLLRLGPDGTNPQVLVKALTGPGGVRAFQEDSVRFVADRVRTDPERDGGTVFEFTPGEPLEVVIRSGFTEPQDLALDVLDATYLTAEAQRQDGHPQRGIIGKAFADETVARFATGLRAPQGIAFDPQGNLYVAETEAGRIVRFRAPAAPTLDPTPPRFTREATVSLQGRTEPHALLSIRGAQIALPPQSDVTAQIAVRRSRIHFQHRTGLLIQRVVLTNTGGTSVAAPLAVVVTAMTPAGVSLANATTSVHDNPAVEVPLVGGLLRPGESARVFLTFRLPDDQRHIAHLTYTHEVWALRAVATSDAEGQFSFPVTLTANTENQLEVYATAAFGLGLTSAPVKAAVLYDSRPPTVHVTKPAPGAFVRGSVEVASEATDPMQEGEAWSGVAGLMLKQAETALITAPNPTPDSPLPHRGSAAWDTTALRDGPYLLTATARDRAGNAASDSITVTVDNTPPTLAFTAPLNEATVGGTEGVTVIGGDATSGLDTLSLFVDGVLRQTSTSSPLTYLLDTRPLAAGLHTLMATATDRAGNTAALGRNVTVQNLLVRILSPVDGASISQDRVRVTGTVEGQGEIGVVVNGVLAFVTGAQWAAEVRLMPGSNSITATATDAQGASSTARIVVEVTQPQEPALVLTASPVSGLAPLSVRFNVQSSLDRPIVKYDLDTNGDGTIDLTSATFENVEVTYTNPSLTTPTLTVTDDQGRTVTATSTLQVLDATATVAMLVNKWEGLKAALAARDIPRATAEMATGVRARFQAVFQALEADLPTIGATLGAVSITQVTGGLAEGAVQRVQAGKTYLYFIYWAPDTDGIWRIIEM